MKGPTAVTMGRMESRTVIFIVGRLIWDMLGGFGCVRWLLFVLSDRIYLFVLWQPGMSEKGGVKSGPDQCYCLVHQLDVAPSVHQFGALQKTSGEP